MRDLRHGLRMLARSPGSTMLVVCLLAMGIGTTTIIFGLFDAVLLRPLPVRDPEGLVRIVQRLPKIGALSSFPDAYYEALRGGTSSLKFVFGETGKYFHFVMSVPAPAEEITLRAVTPEFFAALGVQALYGRVLMSDDATQGSKTPAAVLSYSFWQRRFGGDPRVVNGGTVAVNGHFFAIVGVMRRDFNGVAIDSAPDLWIPLNAYGPLADISADSIKFELAGRLKPGFTLLQAAAECRSIWQYTMKDYYQRVDNLSESEASNLVMRGVELEPFGRGASILRDSFGNVLKLLMVSVALLLSIVCFNVGGVLLARAATRQQEFAVRLAIGATGLTLMRQILIEGLLLAILGAAAGVLIAFTAMPFVLHLLPPMRDLSGSLVPLSLHAGMNWQVVLFVLALSILTTLLFSLSPAIAVSRSNLDCLLRAARASSGTRGRKALIVLQIALCTVMLAIASMFVRTCQQLQRVDVGFDRNHIATFTGDFSGYAGVDAPAFLRVITERVREIPGVVSIATSSVALMRGRGIASTVAPTGQRMTQADFLDASGNYVSPEYFETMGMHILSGRGLAVSDDSGPKPTGSLVAVVNQVFAQRFFPNVDPVGKQFGISVNGVANGKYQIVGVVSDAKYRSLREPIIPTFYTLETPSTSFILNVRTRMQPEGIIEPVRKALASVNPDLAFLEVHTMNEEVDNSMANERLTAAMASIFAGVAALFVGVGIYGLLAYVATQRRREIGIRMALGAPPVQIAKLIAGQSLVMTAAGIVLGLGAALVAGRGIHLLLYGVSPQDPKSLAAATAFVAVVAAAATAMPVVRAIRTEPAETLRYEN